MGSYPTLDAFRNVANNTGGPRQKISPEEQAERDAYVKRHSELVSGISTIGKGAVSFKDIDTYLKENPDTQFFRIGNGGRVSGRDKMRSGTGQHTWLDSNAAISNDTDKFKTQDRRYVNISPAGSVRGKWSESGIGIAYTPQEFYKANNLQFFGDDGLILSRDEYGKLKENVKAKDKSGFLVQHEKQAGTRIERGTAKDDGNIVLNKRRRGPSNETILTDREGGLGTGTALSQATILG